LSIADVDATLVSRLFGLFFCPVFEHLIFPLLATILGMLFGYRASLSDPAAPEDGIASPGVRPGGWPWSPFERLLATF
jgi:hypothetical protein